MLIEQIVEYESRGSGPSGRTCIPITGYFHDKSKIFNENPSSGLLFTAKF